MPEAPRYYVVRKPDAGGTTVAKYDSPADRQIDPEIADHDDFAIVELPDADALREESVDTNVLTEAEAEILSVPR